MSLVISRAPASEKEEGKHEPLCIVSMGLRFLSVNYVCALPGMSEARMV